MAQNQFLNITMGVKRADGSYDHVPAHGSAGASDLTISWDSAKIVSKSSFRAALVKAETFINSRNDLPA